MEQRLLTLKQAAIYLGRSEYALRSMIAQRKIAYVQEDEGCKIMFDKKVLNNYIEANTIPSDS